MRLHSIVVAALAGLANLAGSAAADVIPDRATLDAILGGNQILEDFESFDIAAGAAASLDVFSLDSTTIAGGQGPGLVEPLATYLDPSRVQLQWNGDTYFGLESKTLLANGATGDLWIVYDTPMRAIGLDLRAFSGFGWTGAVDVYSPGNVLLGTINASLATGGAENVFAGWEDVGGIGHIEISSPNYSWSPVIDNHGYGVPAPGAIAVLGLGAILRRRTR
jgi:hypothetical protein